MADLLLDLARRPLAKRLVRNLRLPLSLPEPLVRAHGPWDTHPLERQTVAVVGTKSSPLVETIKPLLQDCGAKLVDGRNSDEAFGAIVCDATFFHHPDDLGGLYDLIKPRLSRLSTSGRIVILGRSKAASQSAVERAMASALRGFAKSLAKELGRKGTTCNVLSVHPESLKWTDTLWPLVFLLSTRSAYISGQTLEITESPTVELGSAASEGVINSLAGTSILSGKTALVTGAARGIGAAIARRLATEGARVIGLDRPGERHALEALMIEIGGIPFVYDLLAPGVVESITSRLELEIGSLDILVHNAGVTRDKTLGRMPRDYWDDTLAINLKAPIDLTTSLVLSDSGLIRLMGPGGRVIFMSSVSGIAGNAGQTNYAAAKAGLIGYTEALAPKLAPRSITVNAVAPGFIETQMTQSMPLALRELARRLNALGQGGIPEDIAEAVVFLAAPGAKGISGSVLRVCGQSLIGA